MSSGLASIGSEKTSCSSRPPSRTPVGLAGEVDRDLGGHGDVAADPDEVDVDEVAPQRVALDLAGEGEDVVAVDLERDQRVDAAVALEDVLELTGGDGDVDGVGAEAVDDRGNHAVAPEPSGGAGAEVGARLGDESVRRP